MTQNRVATGGRDTKPGAVTHNRVVVPGGHTSASRELPATHSHVRIAGDISPGIVTDRYVVTASSVTEKRINTHGLVKATGREISERVTPVRVVKIAGGRRSRTGLALKRVQAKG